MSNFDEKLIERLKRLEREVERLQVKERPAGGGVTDHGNLTGLGDNDHTQYLLTTGKAADSDKLDGNDSTAFATSTHNHDTAYLGITAKAADSDKLDNIDSSGFVQTSGNQTIAGIKTFSSFPVTPSSAPSSNYQTANKKYVDDSVSPLGAWQSYTVSWTAATTNPSIGNGTLTGRYVQIGKTVICAVSLTMGSTTTYGSGSWNLSLPKTSANSGVYYGGQWMAVDLGTTNHAGQVFLLPNASVINYFLRENVVLDYLNNITPHAWASGDVLRFSVTYETA